MTQDKPLLGISLMLGFCIVAPMGDAVAKLLGQSMPLGQLLLVRFALQVLLLWPLVWLTGCTWRVSGVVLWLTLLRAFMHLCGIGAMFTALQYLPLADAVAIAFVMPFIMLLMGHYILNETVGHRRFTACLVGFLGTLMVVQPSFAEVGWPALLPILVALIFSSFMLITRRIAKEVDPIGSQAVSGLMAVGLMAPVLLIFGQGDFAPLQIVTPDNREWGLLLAIGCFGTLAHLLMTWSLRYAPSATVAPMQYLEIPVATLIGFLIFQEWPNGLAAAGICITLAAGLYVVMQERANAAREKEPEVPQQDRQAAFAQ